MIHMASGDWLDIVGWSESFTSWSMDNVHDVMPSNDIDMEVTIPKIGRAACRERV